MPDLPSHHHLRVSAEERVHPAMRKLARACIELARQVIGLRPDPGPAEPNEDAQAGQPEQTHD